MKPALVRSGLRVGGDLDLQEFVQIGAILYFPALQTLESSAVAI